MVRAVWFKVQQEGRNGNTWGATPTMKAGGSVSYTIPKCISSGNYLVRHEIIALHASSSYPGAQFYPVRSHGLLFITLHVLTYLRAAINSRLPAVVALRPPALFRSQAHTRALILASLMMLLKVSSYTVLRLVDLPC